jgi:hypothetical protein
MSGTYEKYKNGKCFLKKLNNKPNGLNRSYHFFKSDDFVIFLFENYLYTENE